MTVRYLFWFPLFTLFISLNGCTNDESNSVTNLPAKSLQNISYGSSSQQVFDLYLPANRTSNTKTLILVHGGGWVEGDKQDMNYAVDIIKQYLPDYAIVNMNYRLATTGNPAFPMQINDLSAVVSKLKNTNSYVISDDFGFIGVSAGAHLSLLYSYVYDPSIKMICSIVGPTNFTDINYSSDPFMINLFQTATGIDYATNQTFYEEISPLLKTNFNSQPTILLYGNADPLIPTTQGQDLHNKLNQFGVYNEFYLYNGGHGDWNINDQIDAYGKMVTFIQNKF